MEGKARLERLISSVRCVEEPFCFTQQQRRSSTKIFARKAAQVGGVKDKRNASQFWTMVSSPTAHRSLRKHFQVACSAPHRPSPESPHADLRPQSNAKPFQTALAFWLVAAGLSRELRNQHTRNATEACLSKPWLLPLLRVSECNSPFKSGTIATTFQKYWARVLHQQKRCVATLEEELRRPFGSGAMETGSRHPCQHSSPVLLGNPFYQTAIMEMSAKSGDVGTDGLSSNSHVALDPLWNNKVSLIKHITCWQLHDASKSFSVIFSQVLRCEEVV